MLAMEKLCAALSWTGGKYTGVNVLLDLRTKHTTCALSSPDDLAASCLLQITYGISMLTRPHPSDDFSLVHIRGIPQTSLIRESAHLCGSALDYRISLCTRQSSNSHISRTFNPSGADLSGFFMFNFNHGLLISSPTRAQPSFIDNRWNSAIFVHGRPSTPSSSLGPPVILPQCS